MDALLTAVLGAAPQLGGAAGLVTLVVLLIRQNLAAAERYATDLSLTRAANTAELARVGAAHDGELAELRTEIARQRELRTAAEHALDVERGLRRAAEDTGRHRAHEQEGGPSPWAG